LFYFIFFVRSRPRRDASRDVRDRGRVRVRHASLVCPDLVGAHRRPEEDPAGDRPRHRQGQRRHLGRQTHVRLQVLFKLSQFVEVALQFTKIN
jgi:hypothetical protein